MAAFKGCNVDLREQLDPYNYALPDEQIARFPLENRDDSRLLSLCPEILDASIQHLPNLLRAGDLLVLNNTKVMAARLHVRRQTGGRVELLIVDRISDQKVRVLAKPSRKLKVQETLIFEGKENTFRVVLDSYEGEGYWLANCFPDSLTIMDLHGEIPIPPYFQRSATPQDILRYQTTYAKRNGAVAAPTAGLHLTTTLFEALKARHISTAQLTLHVALEHFEIYKNEIFKKDYFTQKIIFWTKRMLKKSGTVKRMEVGSLPLGRHRLVVWNPLQFDMEKLFQNQLLHGFLYVILFRFRL
jgi:S-adenosylmethionine:tRNA ribosyltransferase-isomerase